MMLVVEAYMHVSSPFGQCTCNIGTMGPRELGILTSRLLARVGCLSKNPNVPGPFLMLLF
jgi:hypothetical protein